MHILITGANRGLGLGLCQIYVHRSDHVTACARTPEQSEALLELQKKHPKTLTVCKLDVTDEVSCKALPQSLAAPSIDIVINNAGAYPHGNTLSEIDFASAEKAMQANAFGPLRVTRAVVKNLKSPGAKLISITSLMGSIADNKNGGSYGYRMSKAALNMAMKCLSIELSAAGIIVAAVHPGWVKTRMGGEQAPLDVEQSTRGMVSTIETLTSEMSGGFYNYDGKVIAW